MAGQGLARHGKVWQAGLGRVRQGGARRGMARLGMVRQARRGAVWQVNEAIMVRRLIWMARIKLITWQVSWLLWRLNRRASGRLPESPSRGSRR